MNHNKINYIISGVLAVGIIILFILQSNNKQRVINHSDSPDQHNDSISMLSLAYIDVDSLLLSYFLAVDLRGQIVVKEENSRSIITQRVRDLELQMRRYKQKLEENPFLPREQSDAEYRRIIQKQHEIYELEIQLTKELKDEQDRVYQQLYDSIIQQLRLYNESRKISIFFSNAGGDNILYAKEYYNATQEVINFLNTKFTTPLLQGQQ